MNALLVYPQCPDSYWSFRHALSFQGKRAAQPPLGLLTVAALLPASWDRRLVDTNVEPLKEADLVWADVVLLSGMLIQRDPLLSIVRRCRARGVRTVVGGPISSSLTPDELEADHIVIGEAEGLVAALARDIERGVAQPVYCAAERPSMEQSPLPDLSLVRMKRYGTMTVQYSRGCPFNCEFCNIVEIYGRRPRTKAVAQVLAELDQLCAAGWRGPVFIVDDNFIGNKVRVRELLSALIEWQREHQYLFRFITEASLNLADDEELLHAMRDAGFASVFLGIETPSEASLAAANKLQNTRRDMLASIARIQSFGMEVMGGFILGFDTDSEDVFERLVQFIQKSAIPIAMVGLLQAIPNTRLFQRLSREGRILDTGGGNNTSCELNFRPHMNADRLIEGYRFVLRRIYSGDAYFERVREYLSRCRPHYGAHFSLANVRALFFSLMRQGVIGKARLSYWKFLLAALTRYRDCFGAAMTMAVMGYHFQVVTEQIVSAEPS